MSPADRLTPRVDRRLFVLAAHTGRPSHQLRLLRCWPWRWCRALAAVRHNVQSETRWCASCVMQAERLPQSQTQQITLRLCSTCPIQFEWFWQKQLQHWLLTRTTPNVPVALSSAWSRSPHPLGAMPCVWPRWPTPLDAITSVWPRRSPPDDMRMPWNA